MMHTDQIGTERTLEALQFKMLVEQFPRLVMLSDAHGKIVFWNRRGVEVFGYTFDEVIGRPAGYLFPRITRKQYHRGFRRLKNGLPVAFETEGRHKDGSRVWVDIKSNLIDFQRTEKLVLSTICDISNKVKAEQELASSEGRLKSILETAVDGIITIDSEGHIKSFNTAAEQMFGYRAEELIGRSVSLLMPEPYRDEHEGFMQAGDPAGENRFTGVGREVRGQRKDGTIFPMELSVSRVEYDGEIIYTGMLRDISERRKLENKILEVSEEERRMIGRDLHDGLGQMLTGIGLISQSLARKLKANGLPGSDEVQEIYEMIREADEHAKALAHGLVHIELESEDLYGAIRHLCKRAEKMFKIEVNLELDNSVQVQSAVGRLHLYRIVQEAVSNAVRHGRASRVDVLFSRKDEQVCMVVRDNGVGFGKPGKPETQDGIGMRTMNYRARALGGHLRVGENEEGDTLIICTIPDLSNTNNNSNPTNHG